MTMPRYAQDAIKNQGQGYGQQIFGAGYNPQQLISGVGGILGGLFGNSGAPYQAAIDQLNDYANKSRQVQEPFYNAGAGAIPGFQSWLNTMQNPSQFINSLMGSYQQSPYAKYQIQEANRAAQNFGSASGLTGSTPLMQQAQQNALNISGQDMNSWLQNVLGINSQYGSGLGNLIGVGANSANALTNMYGDFGKALAEQAYNREAGEQNDMWNTIGGIATIGSMFL